MKLRNIEVNFSFTNADDIEKLEKAIREVKEKTEKYKGQEITLSEMIRKECKALDEFFDTVFGEGTSAKIFEGRMDLQEHSELFVEVANEKIKQTRSMQDFYNRYMPNREQRRNNKYNGKR